MNAMDFLQKTPLFSELSKQSIWRLADCAQFKKFKKGDVIISEGESQTGCFVIAKGEVLITKQQSDGKKKKLTQLGPGEIVGEMNIIDNQPHSATVTAITDIDCFMISAWDFKAQMQAYPEIALQLLPIVVKRLRQTQTILLI